jgi:FKBP-type peptidyl-prolyl cis-trans isomerase FkpA
MRRLWGLPAVTIAVLASASPPMRAAEQSAPQADDEKTLYALGVLISRNLEDFQLTPAEFARVKAGLTDGFTHRASEVDLAVDTPKVQALRRQRVARLTKQREEEGRAYLLKAASLPGATQTPSGAILVTLHGGGTSLSPGPRDQVTVNYEGRLIDGTLFDGSLERGQPATFSLSGVIPCWAEALPLMKVGDKSRIVCPPDLAYGPHGAPPKIGPQSTLDFEVELLGITPGQTARTEPTAGAIPR